MLFHAYSGGSTSRTRAETSIRPTCAASTSFWSAIPAETVNGGSSPAATSPRPPAPATDSSWGWTRTPSRSSSRTWTPSRFRHAGSVAHSTKAWRRRNLEGSIPCARPTARESQGTLRAIAVRPIGGIVPGTPDPEGISRIRSRHHSMSVDDARRRCQKEGSVFHEDRRDSLHALRHGACGALGSLGRELVAVVERADRADFDE